MKKILTVVVLPSLCVAAALTGTAQSSNAQEVQSKFARQAQYVIAQSEKDTSITPTSSASAKTGKLPTNYGLVRSASNGTLELRMLDGTSKQMPIPSNLSGSASGLQRGSLVGFDTDKAGNLTRIQPPEVEREFRGTISGINGDQVTLLSPSGETLTTPIETATISRMGLLPGKELIVSSFRGTWATKICCVETPAPVAPIPITPAPTPIPQGGGTPNLAPTPVKGLW